VIARPSNLESASSIEELCRQAKLKLVPPRQWEAAELPSIEECGTVEDIQTVGLLISVLSDCAYRFYSQKNIVLVRTMDKV
jgi:hypothetical protein